MKYGYARVSTSKQYKDGNSIEYQRELLKQNGAEIIYEDKFTGTKVERPELDKLLNIVKEGDVIIVSKLDRIARSIHKGSELIESLINRGITINILNLGILNNDPTSKLIRNIFLSFAEFERDMIVERTQEGKTVARQKDNYIEGRPKKFKRKQIEHALLLLKDNSYNQVSELTGISVSTLVRAKRKEKLKELT